jgi:hypothetical protein
MAAVYCYARPTHSYLNLSPGLDFETQIIAKHNIAEVLRAELARPGHVPRTLNLGSATDCYQPVERELRLTRGVIEVLRDARHPFSLITKSSGVERDLDLHGAHGRAAPGRGVCDHHHAGCRSWPAAWSRAPPRRTGACAPSARWPMRACPWA